MIKWIIFLLVNIILAVFYLYGAEHNRHICLILWAVAPMVNALMIPMFDRR